MADQRLLWKALVDAQRAAGELRALVFLDARRHERLATLFDDIASGLYVSSDKRSCSYNLPALEVRQLARSYAYVVENRVTRRRSTRFIELCRQNDATIGRRCRVWLALVDEMIARVERTRTLTEMHVVQMPACVLEVLDVRSVSGAELRRLIDAVARGGHAEEAAFVADRAAAAGAAAVMPVSTESGESVSSAIISAAATRVSNSDEEEVADAGGMRVMRTMP